MNLPPSRILTAVGLPLFLVGWGTVPAWKFVEWTRPFGDMTTTDVPLGHLRDVAVDPAGRIYVADNFHSRVQRYSPDGRFERGWFVPTAGAFALRTTDRGQVKIATARANKLLTYSADGELLNDLYHQEEHHYRDYQDETDTTGPYAVRGGLWPGVIDRRTGRVVVSRPWPLGLVAAWFPAVAYFLVGLGLLVLGDWRRERESAAATPPKSPSPHPGDPRTTA